MESGITANSDFISAVLGLIEVEAVVVPTLTIPLSALIEVEADISNTLEALIALSALIEVEASVTLTLIILLSGLSDSEVSSYGYLTVTGEEGLDSTVIRY